MIFPSLSFKNVLQVDDKTRLNASKSFITASKTDEIKTLYIHDCESKEVIELINICEDYRWYLLIVKMKKLFK